MKIKTAGPGENPVAHHLELQTGDRWNRDSVRRWAMGLTPLGVLQPQKEGHEKPATAKGRPEERSLPTATGLLHPERQPFGLPFGLPSMVE